MFIRRREKCVNKFRIHWLCSLESQMRFVNVINVLMLMICVACLPSTVSHGWFLSNTRIQRWLHLFSVLSAPFSRISMFCVLIWCHNITPRHITITHTHTHYRRPDALCDYCSQVEDQKCDAFEWHCNYRMKFTSCWDWMYPQSTICCRMYWPFKKNVKYTAPKQSIAKKKNTEWNKM